MSDKKLRLDISGAVADLESALKDLKLRIRLYRPVFRGRGLEFDSFRYYSPGDDAEDIDWKASKRANKLLVKQFIEERDLKLILAVDVSENMVFGSTEKLKCEYNAEVAAALAHLIMKSNDKVGLILYGSEVIEYLPPSRGDQHFRIIVDKISQVSFYGGHSNIKKAINFINSYMDNSISGIIFLSDFIRVKPDLKKDLTLLSSRFETLSIVLRDPVDMRLPRVNREVMVEDPSTGEIVLMNPKIVGKLYEKNAAEQLKNVVKLFDDSGIDSLQLMTDKAFALGLSQFISGRTQEAGR